ncbi:MAG: hypothetical protein HY326_08880 [Chloroflexi bacterium]|nr:hypothetical protein [Chloroflexota bacterium]
MPCLEHEFIEIGRVRKEKVREDIIITTERVKHFTREGGEIWKEMPMPKVVKMQVTYDGVELRCQKCGLVKTKDEIIAEVPLVQ